MRKLSIIILTVVFIALIVPHAFALSLSTKGFAVELPDSFISLGDMDGVDSYLDFSRSIVFGVLVSDDGISMQDLLSDSTGLTLGNLETRYTESGIAYMYVDATEKETGAALVCAVFQHDETALLFILTSLNTLNDSDKELFESILYTVVSSEPTHESTSSPTGKTRIAGVRTPQPLVTHEPTPETTYAPLQKGDKGDDVKQLQLRLIELNYLMGGADGDFGNKTKEAVELFQSVVKQPVTGIADHEMQKALFADNAPRAKVYNAMDFKELSRNPEQHKGEYYSFSGQVVQVSENANWNGTTSVTLRIATKGGYDDVVMVTYTRQGNDSRILEDDKVMVKGEYKGIQSYTAVMGNTVTVPLFEGEVVSLR